MLLVRAAATQAAKAQLRRRRSRAQPARTCGALQNCTSCTAVRPRRTDLAPHLGCTGARAVHGGPQGSQHAQPGVAGMLWDPQD
eukprot:CAMPEP_0179998756 /NCGR_PEP_ID=MMETSP0984-20121128/8865_1 /TAXON_ID=483367 /ORGANISM="non described non described, Strain CCMP 2436" /LENGTH=83 /DNA_ID=CAMNT_0021918489 /DNA_START=235 /DNA_END=483 /DNA_ORIENTATION=+